MNEKAIELVDRMIANKRIVDGEIYFRAQDVNAITDFLYDLHHSNLEAIKNIVN